MVLRTHHHDPCILTTPRRVSQSHLCPPPPPGPGTPHTHTHTPSLVYSPASSGTKVSYAHRKPSEISLHCATTAPLHHSVTMQLALLLRPILPCQAVTQAGDVLRMGPCCFSS